MARRVNDRWLFGAGLVGLALRLVLVAVFVGTNDMEGWTTFGENLAGHPLCYVYPNVVGMYGQFNHPPLVGVLVGALWSLSVRTHVPFHVVFKLVPVLADFGTAAVIFRSTRRRSGERAAAIAFCAYGWSLVSMLIAGVHGNTDAIGVCFAALAFDCFDRDRPLLAGVALAASLNVKLIPVVLVIALVAQVRDVATLVRFGFGLSLALMPLGLVNECRRVFLDKVVAYVPHHDSWGLPHFFALGMGKRALVRAMTTLSARYDAIGRYVPIVGALAVSLWVRLRRGSVFVAGAATFAVFLLSAVGFGVQYLLYLAPFLFLVDWRLGAVYATSAGAFVAMVYLPFVSNELPYLIHMFGRIGPRPARVGVFVWLWIAVCLVVLLRRTGSTDRMARPARSA